MREYLGQYIEAVECSKLAVNEVKETFDSTNKDDVERLRIANAMLNDMRLMTRWAESGHDPLDMYAANRIDAYTMDPYTLESITTQANADYLIDDLLYVEHDDNSKDGQRRLDIAYEVECAMTGLTEREKTAFVLYKAEKLQISKVAEAMDGISVETVRVYVRRAEQKIRKNITIGTQESLDLAL